MLNQDQKHIRKKYQEVKQHIQNTPEFLQKDTSTSSEQQDNMDRPEHPKPNQKQSDKSPQTEEEKTQTEDTEVHIEMKKQMPTVPVNAQLSPLPAQMQKHLPQTMYKRQ